MGWVRTIRLLMASAAACLLLAMVGVAGAAPPDHAKGGGGGGCNPKKSLCTGGEGTSTTSTTTTTTTTTTTAPPDATAPTVAIGSPTDGATVDGPVVMAGTSDDDRSVARVEIRVDGGAWRSVTGTTSWDGSVDTAAWAAGSVHELAARAIDTSGNASALATVAVQTPSAPQPPAGEPTGDASVAPDTQGTWVSPEGTTIDVATTGAWTVRDVYRMLLENSSAPGDFAGIAPTLTIKVQDQYASQVTTSSRSSDGVYTRFSATMYLKASSSTFSSRPDSQLAHEYGHVWSLYHLYLSQNGDWSRYLDTRWAAIDGTALAHDGRLDSSYTWDRAEIIADDYRLLFGSAAAVAQRPTHMNADIPQPADQAGLRDFLVRTWAV